MNKILLSTIYLVLFGVLCSVIFMMRRDPRPELLPSEIGESQAVRESSPLDTTAESSSPSPEFSSRSVREETRRVMIGEASSPKARVSGRLLSPNGIPLEGFFVEALDLDGKHSQTKTTSGGKFEMLLAAGDYWIVASLPRSQTSIKNPWSHCRWIETSPPEHLRSTPIGRLGGAFGGRRNLIARRGRAWGARMVAVSDIPSRYVRKMSDFHNPTTSEKKDLILAAGEHREIHFVTDKKITRIAFWDELTGKSVPERIYLKDREEKRSHYPLETSAEAMYFVELPEGDYRLGHAPYGYRDPPEGALSVFWGDQDLNVSLTPKALIYVRVKSPTGKPPEGSLKIRKLLVDQNPENDQWLFISPSLDREGATHWPEDEGSYLVSFVMEGTRPQDRYIHAPSFGRVVLDLSFPSEVR